MTYEKLYYDGGWQSSTGSETIAVISSATEQEVARVPRGTAEDVDRAVKAARRGFESWSRLPVEERAQWLEKLSAAMKTRVAADRGSDRARSRHRDRICDQGPGRVPDHDDRDERQVHPRGEARRGARQLARHQGTDWRRRLRDAVELSAAPGGLQGRAGAGGRVHDRAEAGGDGAAQRVHARRGRARDRAAEGRAERRLGLGPRRWRGDRRASRRGHGELHRIAPGRTPDCVGRR